MTIGRTMLAAAAALGLLASCSGDIEAASLCEAVEDAAVDRVLGDSQLETFSVDPLDECVWTSNESPEQSVTLRIERVPDAALFVEHAIEATDPDRVERLGLGEESVMFFGEALLGRHGDRVALVTSTLDVDLLVPVLAEALVQLAAP